MDKAFVNEFINRLGTDKELFSRFLAALRGGNNKVIHNAISQSVILEDDWILKIEGTLNSVEQIVHNPRKFIAENPILLDVAKVRRINSKTVQHLSSHSQYVQNIDDKGEVTPKKLLTGELEEDIAIYENRFVCALIKRIVSFVELRYYELNGKLDVFVQNNVCIQSEFDYGDNKLKCNIDLQVNEPPENKDEYDKNLELFERIETIRRRLGVLQTTEFYKKLSKTKPVRAPIQKTNLLAKNVDYNNCYNLWLFLSAYTALGYSVEVQDKFLPVEGDYYDDLTVVAGLSLQSLVNNNIINKQAYEDIPYSEPVEQDYEIVKNYTFTPDFKDNKEQAGEESINEYYFRKMKDELVAAAREGAFEVEKRLNVNFTKFFRAVSRINDEMYNELIEEQIVSEQADEEAKTPIAKKRLEIAKQKERIRRRKLYLKLKWEELERAQRMSERAEAKLEKLKKELREEKMANRPKRIVHKKLTTIKRTRKVGK